MLIQTNNNVRQVTIASVAKLHLGVDIGSKNTSFKTSGKYPTKRCMEELDLRELGRISITEPNRKVGVALVPTFSK